MTPEVKESADVLVSLLGVGGLGGIILAFLGIFSGKKQAADDEKPKATVGREGVAQIGALMLDGSVGKELVGAIDRLTLAYEHCTQARQEETRIYREHNEDVRRLTEEVGVLSRNMSRLKCS